MAWKLPSNPFYKKYIAPTVRGQQPVTADPLQFNQPQGTTTVQAPVAAPTDPARDPMQFNLPQGTTTTATPVMAPTVAAPQNNSDPMQFNSETAFRPVQTPTTPSLFSGTAPGIGENYAKTLNQSLTGEIYDPFAAGTKEAQSRAAANARASTAGQIAKAGFAGTGIGTSVAGATDNQLEKQKYDTMIGIEQARNEGRVNALGEARAYGSAEEGIRQYEQNFGQDKMIDQRNFDEDVRRYGQDFAENKRRYDETTAEDKKRYGDTQNAQAYEAALVNGSDADVIAAYKAWTGKDLDPAAVATYRGYARTAAEQDLAKGAADLTSDVGKRFSADVINDPNLTAENFMGNETVKASLQALWDTLPGKKGTPFDQAWAAQQIKAVKDSSNTYIMAGKAIDEAVAAGTIPNDVGETMKNVGNNAAFWSAFDIDENGNAVPNLERMEKALGLEAGSLGGDSGDGTGDTSTAEFDPETASATEMWGNAADKILTDTPTSDKAAAIVNARADAVIKGTEPWSSLGAVGKGDPVYDRIVETMPVAKISYNNDGTGWRYLETYTPNKTVLNVNTPAGTQPLLFIRKGGDTTGEFKTLDGKTTYRISVSKTGPVFWVSTDGVNFTKQ